MPYDKYTTTDINFTGAEALTIKDGTVTVDNVMHTLVPEIEVYGDEEFVDEPGPSDELDTISRGGLESNRLALELEDGNTTVTLKHGTGNIKHPDNKDLVLDEPDEQVMLNYNGTNWEIISFDSSEGIRDKVAKFLTEGLSITLSHDDKNNELKIADSKNIVIYGGLSDTFFYDSTLNGGTPSTDFSNKNISGGSPDSISR